MISAEQRYRNAITKARIIQRRTLIAFLSGAAAHSGRPGFDIERECIIAEFRRLHEEIALGQAALKSEEGAHDRTKALAWDACTAPRRPRSTTAGGLS